MFFVLRALFWIAIVFMLMPESSAQRLSRSTGLAVAAQRPVGESIATAGQLTAAAGYCLRHADTCRAGAETARRFGGRMERAAQLVGAFFEAPASTDDVTASVASVRRTSGPRLDIAR